MPILGLSSTEVLLLSSSDPAIATQYDHETNQPKRDASGNLIPKINEDGTKDYRVKCLVDGARGELEPVTVVVSSDTNPVAGMQAGDRITLDGAVISWGQLSGQRGGNMWIRVDAKAIKKAAK